MPHSKIGAIQCNTCGRFSRAKDDMPCGFCNPSGRVQRRLAKKRQKRCQHQPRDYRAENGRIVTICTECGLIMSGERE